VIGAIAAILGRLATLRPTALGARIRLLVGLLAALLMLADATGAVADHGGPLRDAPMSPFTAAALFAGLALLVGAVVLVVVRVLTRHR
jgi:hypothetical protein